MMPDVLISNKLPFEKSAFVESEFKFCSIYRLHVCHLFRPENETTTIDGFSEEF